jgi:XTP/dITP diphosphohydrolase
VILIMEELVFATNNLHKLKEIREIAGDRFRIRSLADIGCREEIPEEAPTLEGNALQKARFIFERYGLDCFADDTGLEVEALLGRPGVKSARYAGEDCIPENNIQKVLAEMEGITHRAARFRTVIALIIQGKETLFEGTVEGRIIGQKRGADGFGYDPVFVPDGYEKTFAEMSAEEKNAISHRGRAAEKLIAYLKRPASPR